MEEQSALNNQQPIVNNEQGKKKHPLTALAFLEIGLFEVGFVIIVLLLIFGTLNFFNILPVSDAFPNQLGWLPKQTKTVPQGVALQTQKDVPNGTSLPTPTISPEETARKLFYTFTSKNLNPSIAPSMSDIVLKQDNTETNTFTVSWAKQAGTSSATFAVSQDQNISYLYINLTYNADSKTVVSSQLAEEITSIFFSTKLQGKWGCKPIYGNTYCENFWEENGSTKKGVSISGPVTLLNKQASVMVSMCEFSKKSSLYSRKSCTNEFANTGIQ